MDQGWHAKPKVGKEGKVDMGGAQTETETGYAGQSSGVRAARDPDIQFKLAGWVPLLRAKRNESTVRNDGCSQDRSCQLLLMK